MKIIISHDVDHIRVWEHKRDLIIPKFLVRNAIEWSGGIISGKEFRLRLASILKNKWQNIEELIVFNKSESIPSTFFIGVNNGLGLSYSLEDAAYWINRVLENEVDVGVHGITFDDVDGIKDEYNIFKKVSRLTNFGIRMHYLRNDKRMLNYLNKSGYIFDTTLYEFKNPFKIGNLWEFPLHIMDVYLFNNKSRWQNQSLEQAKIITKTKIDEALKREIKYFSILFHSRSFSEAFKSYKEWYIWVIQYLKTNKLEFINYREAIKELENKYNYPTYK